MIALAKLRGLALRPAAIGSRIAAALTGWLLVP
jgi:hypothetical protein